MRAILPQPKPQAALSRAADLHALGSLSRLASGLSGQPQKLKGRLPTCLLLHARRSESGWKRGRSLANLFKLGGSEEDLQLKESVQEAAGLLEDSLVEAGGGSPPAQRPEMEEGEEDLGAPPPPS